MELYFDDVWNKRYEQTKMELKQKIMKEVGDAFWNVYHAEENKDAKYRVVVEKVEAAKKSVAKVADEAVEVAKEGAKVVRKGTK